MSLVVLFSKATTLYELPLEGGCTLYAPVNQPKDIPDKLMRRKLKAEFSPYIKQHKRKSNESL